MGRYGITPIETEYRGTRFRSRLEARWAIFFDNMKLEWTYEPESFDLGSYLYKPDFWIPDIMCFCEVKPDWKHVTDDTLEQCVLLAKSTKKPVLILDGLPDYKGYRICTGHGVYPGAYACLTLDRLYGDMDACIRALGENVAYKDAVESARGHRFDPPN